MEEEEEKEEGNERGKEKRREEQRGNEEEQIKRAEEICPQRRRIGQPEKTADLPEHHHWFPREMTSRNQYRNSILTMRHYPDLGSASDLIVYANFPCDTTDQKHYPNLASSDMSSVWNSCTCFSDDISHGNQQCVTKCWLVSQAKHREEIKIIIYQRTKRNKAHH